MSKSKPIGLAWRSSTPFILAVVAVGLFSDTFIYLMILPILPFMLRDRFNLSPNEIQYNISIMLAAFSLARVVFGLPAGWLADWCTTRRVPYLAGLAALIAATVLFVFSPNVPLLVISRILQGVSAAVVYAAGFAMVIDTVEPRNVGKALGSVFSFSAVGELIAPVIGGVLYSALGLYGLLGVSVFVIMADFLMRLFVIEKSVAQLYDIVPETGYPGDTEDTAGIGETVATSHPITESETAPLLATSLQSSDKATPNRLIAVFPILRCCSDIRLLVALFCGFVECVVIGAFDATLAAESGDEFGFSSQQAGAIYLAIGLPSPIVQPLVGAAMDKFGARTVATTALALYTPALVLLRLPAQLRLPRTNSIVLFCCILAFNGVCFAALNTSSVFAAQKVVESHVKRNPTLFGPKGPYGQLFGLSGMVYSVALTIGPIAAGFLRSSIGYGNMNAVFAACTALAAILAFIFLEDRIE